MLPDIGGSELLVIVIVALIVVGPKDLPALLRKLGQMMAKVRGMAAEFRASFDEMARQSELDELRREVEAMRQGHAADMAAFHATEADVAQAFDEIGQDLHAAPHPEPVTVSAAPPAVDPADAMPASEPPPAPKPRKPRAKKAAAAPEGEAAPAPKPRARRTRTAS